MPAQRWLAAFLISYVAVACANDADKVAELKQRTLSSSDGVVHFNTDDFNHFVDGPSRPYSLILIATASHLMDKSGLNLKQLRKNFGVAGSAIKRLYKDDNEALLKSPVFFVDIEYNKDQDLFRRLDVQMLPLIAYISKSLKVVPDATLELTERDKMDAGSYVEYPWSGQDIFDYMRSRTGVDIQIPPKPSLLNDPALPLYLIVALMLGSVIAYKLYYARFMRFRGLYLVGGLFIYWASVSGVMYNIIRGMPLFIPRDEGPQLFLQGNQGQLGAEGFLMGACYTGFGIAIAAISLGGPSIRVAWAQRLLCYVALVIAFFTYRSMFDVLKWKQGYNVHSYLFD